MAERVRSVPAFAREAYVPAFTPGIISPDELIALMRKDVERAVRSGKISLNESRQLLRFYESGLEGYTYLEEP